MFFLLFVAALFLNLLLVAIVLPVTSGIYLLAIGVGGFALLLYQPGLWRDIDAVKVTVGRLFQIDFGGNLLFASRTDDSGLWYAAREVRPGRLLSPDGHLLSSR